MLNREWCILAFGEPQDIKRSPVVRWGRMEKVWRTNLAGRLPYSPGPLSLWLGARHSGYKDLLPTCPRIIPERMGEEVICSKPLIVPNKLQATPVNGDVDCLVPTLCSYTYILEERATMIARLGEIDIDQLVVRINAHVEKRCADDAVKDNRKSFHKHWLFG